MDCRCLMSVPLKPDQYGAMRPHASKEPLPGPPKDPKIMAQYPKIESIGSIRSIIFAILEVQVEPRKGEPNLPKKP